MASFSHLRTTQSCTAVLVRDPGVLFQLTDLAGAKPVCMCGGSRVRLHIIQQGLGLSGLTGSGESRSTAGSQLSELSSEVHVLTVPPCDCCPTPPFTLAPASIRPHEKSLQRAKLLGDG